MVILCVINCPSSLRGDLSKWLCEINTGVYVGKINAKVRDELWERVCSNINTGQATMVYSMNNEQGFVFRTHNTTWIPVDYEGITLMKKPINHCDDIENNQFLKRGFSKAAKYEKIRCSANKKSESYVVVDIETTGTDYNKDKIIEIALLKIRKNVIEQQFQCFILSGKVISDEITNITGITNDMIETQGIKEEMAFNKIKEFIGDDLIVGYNVKFDVNFIQKLSERVGKTILIKQTRDVLHIARRKLDDIDNYRLETVATYFGLDISCIHRALPDCILTYEVYSKLNEL